MKKIIILLLCSFMAMPALASKEEKMREYWELQGIDISTLLYQTFFNSYPQQECYFVITQQKKEDARQEFKKMSKPIEEKFIGLFENFTEEELDEMIKYAKSNVGKKERELVPKINQLVQSEMKNFIPVFEKIEKTFPERPQEERSKCLRSKGF